MDPRTNCRAAPFILAPTIEEAMLRAGQAGLLKPAAQRVACTMQADRDVVRSRAETRRRLLPRFAKNVDPPNDFRVFRFHCGKNSVEAIANSLIEFDIGFDGLKFEIRGLYRCLPTPPSSHTTLMVHQCRGQHAAEPTTDRAHVPKRPTPLQRLQRKGLQHLVSL